MDHPDFAPDTAPLEVLPRDLSAYRAGNTGIDYVHRFESGRPGPHVLINALTHGNEICGMVAATHLLDNAVRPKIGTLTVSFANIEAYEAFDLERPYENRQLVHNLNRIWTPNCSTAASKAPSCAARASCARCWTPPTTSSTSIRRAPVQPFWVYYDLPRNAALATAVGTPEVQLVMPAERFPGTGVMGHGRHGDPQSDSGGAVVVECGQHFARSAADLATDVTLRFLGHLGLIDTPASAETAPPARRYMLLEVHMVKSTDFRFTRPVLGFEVFQKGELIAINGGEEIRSPCDDCTIFMPTRMPVVGREAVYLTVQI